MYSKDEIRQLKLSFWQELNYPAYNPKMKGVEFKFDVTRQGVYVILEINLRDEAERLRRYEQIEAYRVIFQDIEGLIWEPFYELESGHVVSRIYLHQPQWDFHRQSDWPQMHQWMTKGMRQLQRAFREIKDAIE